MNCCFRPAAVLLLWLALPITAFAAVDRVKVERAFQVWLATDLWAEARAAGVSRATFDTAFGGVTLDWDMPELEPPGAPPPKVEHQAEFRNPAAYFKESGIETLVRLGREKLTRWERTLAANEARYGVPPGVVVAVWGRESGFGAAALPHQAIRTLATGAFIGRRQELFRSALVAALQIVEAGDIEAARMRSSWAGALGQPQLLPSAFRKYAVDFDGDGRRDIWDSVPDSLASIAHSLSEQGWNRARGWGFEAEVPASVACSLEGPEQGKPMAEWAALGVRRVGGAALPKTKGVGFLLMPAGRFGPAFIVTENFYTVKAYNNSDLYALYILHLADRFADNRPFAAAWGELGGFSRADVAAMQRKLEEAGHDVGGADGLVGFKTRIAVGKAQAEMGKPVTCYPDAAMVRQTK